ncbi:hypothetical protein KI387_025966, partial [Taxus chinensis]
LEKDYEGEADWCSRRRLMANRVRGWRRGGTLPWEGCRGGRRGWREGAAAATEPGQAGGAAASWPEGDRLGCGVWGGSGPRQWKTQRGAGVVVGTVAG